ncbi:MAG: phosphotransferase [Holosporales bacterium]|jgi:thiamine kinase-like enzyme|nr:phosphotransferase [Holosporales bacterium]
MQFFKGFLLILFVITAITRTFHVNCKDVNLAEITAKVMDVRPQKIKLSKLGNWKGLAGKYAFSVGKKKYVLNVFSKTKVDAARKEEIELTRIFSECGIGASFIGKAADNSMYVVEFLNGKTAKFENFHDEKILKTLANVLKKLHKCKVIMREKRQASYVKKLCQNIAKRKTAVPSSFWESYEKYKKLSNNFEMYMVLCHNNLNPQNIIILSDKIVFINPGSCGIANLFQELGYVTLSNGINGHNLDIFLKEYFGRPPDMEEFKTVKLAQKLACFAMSAAFFDHSESKKDKEIKMKDRVNAIDEALKSANILPISTLIEKNTLTNPKLRKKNYIRKAAIGFYKNWLELPEK